MGASAYTCQQYNTALNDTTTGTADPEVLRICLGMVLHFASARVLVKEESVLTAK